MTWQPKKTANETEKNGKWEENKANETENNGRKEEKKETEKNGK